MLTPSEDPSVHLRNSEEKKIVRLSTPLQLPPAMPQRILLPMSLMSPPRSPRAPLLTFLPKYSSSWQQLLAKVQSRSQAPCFQLCSTTSRVFKAKSVAFKKSLVE